MPRSELCAVVIGGGPAGLMAAEMLAAKGRAVDLFDAMPSVGRKFLLAGIGGMNITHAEPHDDFVSRYRDRANVLRPMLDDFGPAALRAWIHELGIETFVGSSGRVFPREMKAAPLLRAWLHRLRQSGVRIHTRHRWRGWDERGDLQFMHRDEAVHVKAGVTILALGGASWQRLGSDGAWLPWLRERDVAVKALMPSNCGFECAWSDIHRQKFAGAPVKNVAMRLAGMNDFKRGEFLITETGIEGSLVYALSADIRDAILRNGKGNEKGNEKGKGKAMIEIDLLPDVSARDLEIRLAKASKGKSLSEHLRRKAGLDKAKVSLLRETNEDLSGLEPVELARCIKYLSLELLRPRPLDEAISSAGGIGFDELDENLMLKKLPGVFCAGEMLDWEAPTGGYLLTACFATGKQAGEGAARWLSRQTG